MGKCNFSIPFTGTADEIRAKAEAAIKKAGGIFEGNATTGSFSLPTPLGEIKGSYVMNNTSPITVDILDKPLFVPCNQIEAKLNRYLNPPNA